MGSDGQIILELLDKSWAALTPAEQRVFEEWMHGAAPRSEEYRCRGAKAVDLFMLMRMYGRRVRRGMASSSSQTMAAVQAVAAPPELEALRLRVEELERQLRLRKRSDDR